MLDARGRWVSSLEDPLPDLWIDAAPFFAAQPLPTLVASDCGNEKLAAENLSTTGVSPWTILKSPGGDRAPPLEYAQHILNDDDAVRSRRPVLVSSLPCNAKLFLRTSALFTGSHFE